MFIGSSILQRQIAGTPLLLKPHVTWRCQMKHRGGEDRRVWRWLQADRWWFLTWLISTFICVWVCVCVLSLRLHTEPTTDSHRGTLMTNILLHGERDAPCIAFTPHSAPRSNTSALTLLPFHSRTEQGDAKAFFMLFTNNTAVYPLQLPRW